MACRPLPLEYFVKFNKKERRAHRESRGHDSLHVDPDLFFGDPGDPGRQKPDYKNLALCKQVFRTLSCVLSGECGDPALQDLTVEAVLPAPNAGRLMVVLRAGHVSSQMTTAEVLTRLEQVHGMLRSRVAEAIVRKRAPELTFQVFRQEVLP
jgi:ribosome-binding factor A